MTALPPLAWLHLVAVRSASRGKVFYDELIGYRRLQARHRAWAVGWLADAPGFAAWLARPNAGVFVVPPSPARQWAKERCSDTDLEIAHAVVSGAFPLLGLDQVDIGNPPRWRRDPRSRREWPLVRLDRFVLDRRDGSDIRTLWELTRSHHLVFLAKAYWRTGDPRFATTFQAHVESWIRENPVGRGPGWSSAMDAAIRAANWIVASLAFAEAQIIPSRFWAELLANVRITAEFIHRHLEWHPVWRGNHYVANAVGLVYVGALFRDSTEGRRWLEAGARILGEEMTYQVHPDGVSFEASLGYHRLVTEFFAVGGELCRHNLPGGLPAEYFTRLREMYAFIQAYLPASGEAPLLGDSDDGRLHKLSARSLNVPGDHRHGLPDGYWGDEPSQSSGYQHGGFFVLRGPTLHCVVRCGAVGLKGAGSHDHNDQLSFELVIAGRRVIVDSGSFLYYGDLKARLQFRATSSHNVVQCGEEEQNPIVTDRPWRVLQDRTRARCEEWTVTPHQTRFVGRHTGFAHRPTRAVCIRGLTLNVAEDHWLLEDRLEGAGNESITWRIHFVPGIVTARPEGRGKWRVVHSILPTRAFLLEAPVSLHARVVTSPISFRYGTAVDRPLLLLEGTVELPCSLRFELEPDPG